MKQCLEKTINHYLALDPETGNRLLVLKDKIVTIELLGIHLTVQIIFTEKNIQLEWENFLKPDLMIRGTPLNFLHMSAARNQRKQFFAEDIVIEGNMELAQQVLAVFDDLEIDWEEYASRWVGDVPAYQAGRLSRKIKNFGKKIGQTFSYNLNEYLHEESNLFPAAEALQDFFQEIDELRLEVDRLEARIANLKEKL
ncbi:MAG TPA: SCP2 sterol-binding domain-containing protein [Gammaproteobacteria bacterium]|nr:SCP2 sterol-binding domain-containing protein [Gammaproteobacteria bacterium]